MYDVVVFGSANLDLVATTGVMPRPGETVLGHSYAEYPGGKGLNQAIAAARSGASVAFFGAVGADQAGELLCATAQAAGVNTDGVTRSPTRATGRALITVAEGAENMIVAIPGANDEARVPGLPDASVVVAQLEVPMRSVIDLFSAARKRGMTTILDPAPAVPLSNELLALCDLILPNEHEVSVIGGAEHLLDCGVGAVVVTRGAAGVSVYESGPDAPPIWEQPAFSVDPIDTTGAGDAFCGALAARLAEGSDLRAAIRWAAAAGALATTKPGAVPSLPRSVETDRLLGSQP